MFTSIAPWESPKQNPPGLGPRLRGRVTDGRPHTITLHTHIYRGRSMHTTFWHLTDVCPEWWVARAAKNTRETLNMECRESFIYAPTCDWQRQLILGSRKSYWLNNFLVSIFFIRVFCFTLLQYRTVFVLRSILIDIRQIISNLMLNDMYNVH